MVKMKFKRRAGIAECRALAAIILRDEAYEALCGVALPDEWAPDFGAEAVLVIFVQGDDGDDSKDEGDDEPLLFSHFSEKNGEETRYIRSFSSVRDYCEQPFANKENEALFLKEERNGEFRDWRVESLRDDSSMDQKQRTNESWYGAASPRIAMDRAFKGWPEGAERVRSMMESIDAPPPVDMKRKVTRGDQGDELDIHAVYRGGLDRAWSRKRRLHTRARMSVRLVAQMGGSRHMHEEEMFWRGAAVLKLAELLEESGYRVEIVGVSQHHVDGWEHLAYASFIVKDARAPLDVEQVAGVVCNAGFARTFGFRDAYAACEHKLRDTVIEPKMEARRILGRTQLVPTGKFTRRTLLARSYVVGSKGAVEVGKLDADGTKTYNVPSSISDAEAAREWVLKSLAELDESGTKEVDE